MIQQSFTATTPITSARESLSPLSFPVPVAFKTSGGLVTPGLVRGPDCYGRAGWLSTRVLGDFEKSMAISGPLPEEAMIEAEIASRLMAKLRIGGDCHMPPLSGDAPLSVVLAGDNFSASAAALVAAQSAHSPGRIAIVIPGRGLSADRLQRIADSAGIAVHRRPVEPWSLVREATDVYAACDDDVAAVALVLGVRLHCYTAISISGWGVTQDAPSVPMRGIVRTREELLTGILILHTSYTDPFTGYPSTCLEAILRAAAWRDLGTANRRVSVCLGISAWKQRGVASLLAADGHRVKFTDRPAVALRAAQKAGGAIAVWASRLPSSLENDAASAGIPLIRVEDGFLRSVGLGSDLMPPWSVVLDSSGIHYDPSSGSDLERILAGRNFTADEISRAGALAQMIVGGSLSKYNVGLNSFDLDSPPGVLKILVPGQVSDDRSVLCGGRGIDPGLELLSRVRRANPDAFIVYKPHPDVDSGHRHGAVSDALALKLVDKIVRGVSMPRLLDAVDEVHTLTSLSGFEALLRGLRVVTYGQPFYAGWGLTHDLAPPIGRSRLLSLGQLVAGALVAHPRYLDPLTKLPCGPEILVERMGRSDLWKPSTLVRMRRIQGAITKRFSSLYRPDKPVYLSPEGRSFLFLQGIGSVFFSDLGKALSARGHYVRRINFNGGDKIFWRAPGAIDYCGDASAWPQFFAARSKEWGTTDIVLFGDCRPLHQSVIPMAKKMGIRVHVFEEGYIRPNWVTLEMGGVNGHSPLPRDAAFYRAAAISLPPAPTPGFTPPSFRDRAITCGLYAAAEMFLRPVFRGYVSHRPWHPLRELVGWCRRLTHGGAAARRSAEALRAIAVAPETFIFPLQLDNDSQIRDHSDFEGTGDAIDHVIASFARHARPGSLLAVKSHPLDNGLRDWRAWATASAARAGVPGRVVFVEDGDLESLIGAARGIVTVNSTVGTLGLALGVPVKTLGRAVYAIPGITYPGTLAEFWQNPVPPDAGLYEDFRRVLASRCLVPGGFFSRQGIDLLVPGAVRRLEEAGTCAIADTALIWKSAA